MSNDGYGLQATAVAGEQRSHRGCVAAMCTLPANFDRGRSSFAKKSLLHMQRIALTL